MGLQIHLTQEIFTFPARRQKAVKCSMYIPVSFDFITTWNQGVFLCSPCILHRRTWWWNRIRIATVWSPKSTHLWNTETLHALWRLHQIYRVIPKERKIFWEIIVISLSETNVYVNVCLILVSLEFFIDIKSFRSHYGPRVDSTSKKNEYNEHFLGGEEGKGGRCVRLTTLPPSCAVVMKSGNLNFLKPSGPLQDCNGTDLPLPLPF